MILCIYSALHCSNVQFKVCKIFYVNCILCDANYHYDKIHSRNIPEIFWMLTFFACFVVDKFQQCNYRTVSLIHHHYRTTTASVPSLLVGCQATNKNPATVGASQHNSMPVPSPGKWGGKPETQPNIPLKRGFYLLLISSSYFYCKIFTLIHAWIAWIDLCS